MKHISNEQKAREIANDNCTHICLADCSAESYFGSENDCYKAAMEAMEWKDEQILQWLKENLAKETFTMFTSESQGVINFEPTIKAFEKFIKQ
ncbi:MAG: hypothetical protein J6T12_03245 [Salinivirgaceae bacterium]|nr:hypothetical protein [Salinivirgaceae bacterium]